MEMDRAYVTAFAKKAEPEQPTSDIIDIPLTGELFDTLFASVNDNRKRANVVHDYA